MPSYSSFMVILFRSRMYLNPCISRINKSSAQSRTAVLKRGRKGGSSLCAINLLTVGMGCAKTDHFAKELAVLRKAEQAFRLSHCNWSL